MIINNAPANEAIVSNVAEIGEFRIRNSAKAFNILSSGLYANKIKAIIRELSCNAVDSHVAAGKADTPFDIHLPTQMEPWFSIRDYGTGLDHDQVTNIYTTYFESTKTASNEFIGALGLGSKSPFSYTDNFTVSAIKDGKKGVYSAFINEQGVPSIALMSTEDSTDPTGVEIQFAVNEYYDYSKFRDEAHSVYRYFTLKPVVTNLANFEIPEIEYDSKDIVPGVHYVGGYRGSRAVMGNIAYPIDVPNAEKNLGKLTQLLQHGLEIHFDIGELDFQASREGLSYIPQTIDAIKRKLEALNNQLAVHIATEANAISNKWERTVFLAKKGANYLWQAAVEKYINDTNFTMMKTNGHYIAIQDMMMRVEDLATRYNISIRKFSKHHYYDSCNQGSSTTVKARVPNADGTPSYEAAWAITPTAMARFIINDTKTGATERAKYHAKNCGAKETLEYYVLEPVTRGKDMNTKAFFRAIKSPPESQIMLASSLLEKPRAASTPGMGKNVTIMRLEERGNGGYYRQSEMVWRDAGKLSAFDDTKTYYYIPLSGYNIDCPRIANNFGTKRFGQVLSSSGIKALADITVYGVRKGDIETIKSKSNWVEVDKFVQDTLTSLTPDQVKSLAMGCVDKSEFLQYNPDIVKAIGNKKSPYVVAADTVKNSPKADCSRYEVERLFKAYDFALDLNTISEAIIQEHKMVYERYPLLKKFGYVTRDDIKDIAEYINLIDEKKGV
jgi:hypothetical protein